ncbi:DUF262 domain-containing protein [uncultured Fusobacterium sp.]|uniref:DUF262 domain-containing protein n=1 Tax=uncultured Fusobacterium sp. TaxID=159267 RepID=UPI0025E3807C|nr:DUF262 domain-containing protein [uncultured Fusobacterium sp.]
MKDNKLEIQNNIENIRKEIKFSTIDFPIESILNNLEKGRFFIPSYQREYVWDEERKARFIESILMGLPIPFMFLYREKATGKLEIVDGAQRIQALKEYESNNLILNKLDKLKSLNSFKFKDLPEKYQEIFLTTALRMIILDEETTIENRKEIFKRLNTSSKKLEPIEIITGSLEGDFLAFIKECSQNELFLELCKVTKNKSKRKEELELILRFFAYSENLENYQGTVKDFMYDYAELKTKEGFNKEKMLKEFLNMLTFLKKNNITFIKNNKKSVSRTRFEAISIGTNLALKENPALINNIMDLSKLNSKEFDKITSSDAANNKSKLLRRINYVKKLILGE